jgi:AcrR family transcriptional regulator
MKSDLQVRDMSQLTKKCIIESFTVLLNKHPLDRITVTDIAKQCGISRRTFYNYYQDIYQLPEELLYTEFQNISSYQAEFGTWQTWFEKITAFAFKNKTAMMHLYHSSRRDYLEHQVFNIAGGAITDYIKKISENSACRQEDIRILASFYTNAIVGMALEWIKDGMHENPEKTVRKIACLLEGTIKCAVANCTKSHWPL